MSRWTKRRSKMAIWMARWICFPMLTLTHCLHFQLEIFRSHGGMRERMRGNFSWRTMTALMMSFWLMFPRMCSSTPKSYLVRLGCCRRLCSRALNRLKENRCLREISRTAAEGRIFTTNQSRPINQSIKRLIILHNVSKINRSIDRSICQGIISKMFFCSKLSCVGLFKNILGNVRSTKSCRELHFPLTPSPSATCQTWRRTFWATFTVTTTWGWRVGFNVPSTAAGLPRI